MRPVAARPPQEHLLDQQRLAPERHEPPGIEILGMEGPEAHGDCLSQTGFRAREAQAPDEPAGAKGRPF